MIFKRFVWTLVAAIVVTLAAQAPVVADTGAMATVTQFVADFNRGDVKAAAATCAMPTSIVDDFPPHSWQGPTACSDWAKALDADSKREGITDGIVTLGTPWHVDVTGDRAYVVVPATYRYKQRGRLVVESGSILTVALKRSESGWRITGWAWAKH